MLKQERYSSSGDVYKRQDLMRGKTVFHNLFWDLDGSGSDVFTFAYYDGLAADAGPTPSTCEDGKPRNDGSIDIDIRIGTPVYDYVLSADTLSLIHIWAAPRCL